MMQSQPVTRGIDTSMHWLESLDEHDVQFLALDVRDDSNLVKLFRSQPEWMIDFEDREAVLFVRSDDAHVGVMADR